MAPSRGRCCWRTIGASSSGTRRRSRGIGARIARPGELASRRVSSGGRGDQVSVLRRITAWLRGAPDRSRQFPKITEVAALVEVPDDLDPHVIYLVGSSTLRKWAVFACPCERSHRVTLSLQTSHRPHWRVRIRSRGITISPSVDVREWRRCHYWIRDGRVDWVPDFRDRSPVASTRR
jgi:hypothetical protein